MQDEFICEECSYSTPTEEKKCPLCGGRVVSIEDGLDDRNYMDSYDDAPPMADDFEFGADELVA